MTHYLKTWPEYYVASTVGIKDFEVRKNDRGFNVGDFLILQEWNPEKKEYTGREAKRYVTYMIQGVFGLPEDVCVMSVIDPFD